MAPRRSHRDQEDAPPPDEQAPVDPGPPPDDPGRHPGGGDIPGGGGAGPSDPQPVASDPAPPDAPAPSAPPAPGQPPSAPPAPGQPAPPPAARPPAVDMSKIEAALRAMDEQMAALIRAQGAWTEKEFQEKIREFNVRHDEWVQTFGEGQRQFNVNTQKSFVELGSRLSGPADYFKFNNAMNGGRSILDSLRGDKTRPAFSAPPDGSIQPLTLQSIMDRLGISNGQSGGGTAGQPGGGEPVARQPQGTPGNQLNWATASGNNQQSIPGGTGAQPSQQSGSTQTGAANGLTLPNGMGTIPLPHQINPSVWDSWGQTGQAFIKSAAAAAGYDPQEFENQVNATRPGTMRPAPASSSAFSSGGVSAY